MLKNSQMHECIEQKKKLREKRKEEKNSKLVKNEEKLTPNGDSVKRNTHHTIASICVRLVFVSFSCSFCFLNLTLLPLLPFFDRRSVSVLLIWLFALEPVRFFCCCCLVTHWALKVIFPAKFNQQNYRNDFIVAKDFNCFLGNILNSFLIDWTSKGQSCKQEI